MIEEKKRIGGYDLSWGISDFGLAIWEGMGNERFI